MIKVNCKNCNKEIFKYKSCLNERGNFCSKKCFNKIRKGMFFSSEHKNNISLSLKGKVPKNLKFLHSLSKTEKWKKAFIEAGHKANLGRKQSQEERAQKSIIAKQKGFGKWMTGKKLPLETRQKQSEAQKERVRLGLNNFYKNGLTPLYYLIRHCYKYTEWRNQVFKRDNFICINCGYKKGNILNADHFPTAFSEVIKKNNIDNIDKALNCQELWDTKNGRTLCRSCHEKIGIKVNQYSGRLVKKML